MTWPTIFANLAGGNQPAALLDGMFNQVAAMIPIPCTATGTNSLTLQPIGTAPTLSGYSNYNLFSFIAAATSTSTVAAQFQSLASLNVYKSDGTTQSTAGDLVIGRPYMLMYNSTLGGGAGGFYLLRPALLPSGGQPTYQRFFAGSGTYATPANAQQLFVRMCAGGGGGAGGAGSNGNPGNTTSFGSTTALGGGGGVFTGGGGVGGTGGTTGTGTEVARIQGGSGQPGQGPGSSSSATAMGGANPFGGAGANASANTGAGGRADGSVSGGVQAPGGGAAGEYVEFIINNPVATYSYAVGSGGLPGGGTSQSGASGMIYVTERYQD